VSQLIKFTGLLESRLALLKSNCLGNLTKTVSQADKLF